MEGVAMRNKFKILLLFFLPCSAWSTTLSEVVVTAPRYSSWGVGGFGSYYGNAGSVSEVYVAISSFVNSIPLLKDVRCAGGEQKDITSQSAPENRALAAESVFRKYWAAMFAFSRGRFGSGSILPKPNELFEVTYADGGVETYKIISVGSSVALGEAIPNSLNQGDGVVKPRPGCR